MISMPALFSEQECKYGAAGLSGADPDAAVDGRGKIPDERETQPVFDPDIGLVVEQRRLFDRSGTLQYCHSAERTARRCQPL